MVERGPIVLPEDIVTQTEALFASRSMHPHTHKSVQEAATWTSARAQWRSQPAPVVVLPAQDIPVPDELEGRLGRSGTILDVWPVGWPRVALLPRPAMQGHGAGPPDRRTGDKGVGYILPIIVRL